MYNLFNAEVINFFPKYKSYLKFLDAQKLTDSNFLTEDLKYQSKVQNFFRAGEPVPWMFASSA